MNRTPNYDAKVKSILDAIKPGERVCALTGEKWNMTEEEIGWYKKFNVPPHSCAPIPRLKQLLGFPVGIAIWKKPHAETKEPLLTFVHPDSPYQVIPDRDWHNREFAQTTRELDPGEPFFAQFQQLAYSIPVGALRDEGSSTNSVGVDMIKCQDTYLLFGGADLQRVLYASVSFHGSDSACITNTLRVNESYHINAAENMHHCTYCFQCGDCINSAFLFDCSRCQDCFGATNKKDKQFIFWNEQLSEGEYRKRLEMVDLRSRRTWNECSERYLEMIRGEGYFRDHFNFATDVESTGEYLVRATRCRESYWVEGSTDLFQCWMSLDDRDSMSVVWLGWGDAAYCSADIAYYHNLKFCSRSWRCQDLEYCMDCYDCEHCFGCVGLKKKKFHIFNKPYGEEEYWQRVDEIKCAMLDRGEYGMFFPASLSQTGFQFSMGEFYFGYSDDELKKFGAPTFDPTKGNINESEGLLKASELPDRLLDIDVSQHVGKPILDESLNRLYTITPAELAFYQKHRLPIPDKHFLTRLLHLVRHSNVPIPEETTCAICCTSVTTSRNALFSSRRRVLCRPCYLRYMEERG
ncbi:hypothetical protein HYW18_03650 [Candidatus Uhrbacteria bacterium]|nr:hypothetical protein [Candidatus Uhrbacteria bacterium]